MSGEDEDVTMKTTELDKIIKAFKGSLPVIKIGILGNKNARSNSIGESNASIGAKHEFGDTEVPQRSFLRMPLSTNLNKEIEKSGLFDKDALNQTVKEKSLFPWMKKIAIVAEAVIQQAFETGGFGKWAPWANPNYKNGSMRLLDDTGQLRDSITSEVK